jgi:hypothetical protein
LGNRIHVVYLPTGKIIIDKSWANKSFFHFCADYHYDDTTFRILKSPQTSIYPSIYYEFEFTGTDLIEKADYVTELEHIMYPPLPNYLHDIKQNFIIQSPVSTNIYMYEKCLSGTSSDGIYCDNKNTEIVLYDMSLGIEIENLQNAIPDAFRGYSINLYEPDYKQYLGGAKRFKWSPSGRYIIYSIGINPLTQNAQFMIYDLIADTYLNTSEVIYPSSPHHEFDWSITDIVTIWVGYGMGYDGLSTNTQPITATFYHTDTQAYVLADNFYESLESLWSYDGTRFGLVGREFIYPGGDSDLSPYRLIIFDPFTGYSISIDTVDQLLMWRSICDFTATDTASLISTMQSEPYSVICLDENGQYDLTTPLPDVAGDITIIGNGATITMTGQNRVFNVVYNQQWSRNGSLTLKNVTLSGGIADEGGAIYNAGDLTLENVILENHSAVRGGAIYNTGNLVMNGGAIQNNSASEFGGGIYNLGDMQLDGVNIRENTAPEGSGVYQG